MRLAKLIMTSAALSVSSLSLSAMAQVSPVTPVSNNPAGIYGDTFSTATQQYLNQRLNGTGSNVTNRVARQIVSDLVGDQSTVIAQGRTVANTALTQSTSTFTVPAGLPPLPPEVLGSSSAPLLRTSNPVPEVVVPGLTGNTNIPAPLITAPAVPLPLQQAQPASFVPAAPPAYPLPNAQQTTAFGDPLPPLPAVVPNRLTSARTAPLTTGTPLTTSLQGSVLGSLDLAALIMDKTVTVQWPTGNQETAFYARNGRLFHRTSLNDDGVLVGRWWAKDGNQTICTQQLGNTVCTNYLSTPLGSLGSVLGDINGDQLGDFTVVSSSSGDIHDLAGPYADLPLGY